MLSSSLLLNPKYKSALSKGKIKYVSPLSFSRSLFFSSSPWFLFFRFFHLILVQLFLAAKVEKNGNFN